MVTFWWRTRGRDRLPAVVAGVGVTPPSLCGAGLRQVLGRVPAELASHRVAALVRGRRVLVTGAGGGSVALRLCQRLSGYDPESLCLLDHDEAGLYALDQLASGCDLLDHDQIVVADVRDRARIEQVFGDHRPHLVFHAAVQKHLPLLERHPCEAVKSTVAGTRHVVDAAVRHGAERLVFLGTDKAADPTSVVGAAQRVAELVAHSVAGGPTRLASVRLGSVLDAYGSQLSLLADQVAADRAVTVAHPRLTRYVMTTDEAAGLALEAASLCEYAETYALDTGDPVTVVELVLAYARQRRLPPVTIRFTGLRPGERLAERMFGESEIPRPTVHPRIRAVRALEPAPGFGARVDQLVDAAYDNDARRCRELLRRLLPEYRPSERPHNGFGAPYPERF
jgi:FlaA1/EpsC-like NDP-sugar epimerase